MPETSHDAPWGVTARGKSVWWARQKSRFSDGRGQETGTADSRDVTGSAGARAFATP